MQKPPYAQTKSFPEVYSPPAANIVSHRAGGLTLSFPAALQRWSHSHLQTHLSGCSLLAFKKIKVNPSLRIPALSQTHLIGVVELFLP